MEGAVDRFDSLVKTTEDKIEALENKIDQNFTSEVLGKNDEDEAKDPSLLQMLEELKKEHAEICKGAQEVSQFQREIAMAMKEELLGLTNQLLALQTNNPGQTIEETKASAGLEEISNQSDIINQYDVSATNSTLNTT